MSAPNDNIPDNWDDGVEDIPETTQVKDIPKDEIYEGKEIDEDFDRDEPLIIVNWTRLTEGKLVRPRDSHNVEEIEDQRAIRMKYIEALLQDFSSRSELLLSQGVARHGTHRHWMETAAVMETEVLKGTKSDDIYCGPLSYPLSLNGRDVKEMWEVIIREMVWNSVNMLKSHVANCNKSLIWKSELALEIENLAVAQNDLGRELEIESEEAEREPPNTNEDSQTSSILVGKPTDQDDDDHSLKQNNVQDPASMNSNVQSPSNVPNDSSPSTIPVPNQTSSQIDIKNQQISTQKSTPESPEGPILAPAWMKSKVPSPSNHMPSPFPSMTSSSLSDPIDFVPNLGGGESKKKTFGALHAANFLDDSDSHDVMSQQEETEEQDQLIAEERKFVDGTNIDEMNVIDKICAVVFGATSPMAPGISPQEHWNRMADMHAAVRLMWKRDFGCLPPDHLWNTATMSKESDE